MVPAYSRRLVRLAALVVAGVLLVGCDPTVYRKPVEDFRAANRELRAAYFLQLGIARDASVEHFIVQRKRPLWANPNLKDSAEFMAQAAEGIARERARGVLNKDLLALRVQAFEAVDGYAGVLVALASNDDTDAIAEDVKGLIADLQQLAGVAKNVQGIADFATSGAQWLGPIAGAAAAFGEILKLVSAAARERAIRETIVIADAPITRLLSILADEAQFARAEAQSKYGATRDALAARLREGVVDNAAAREITELLAHVSTRLTQLENTEELRKSFEAAKEAQAALVRRVAKPDYAELTRQVRALRTQVGAVKASLEAIRNDR